MTGKQKAAAVISAILLLISLVLLLFTPILGADLHISQKEAESSPDYDPNDFGTALGQGISKVILVLFGAVASMGGAGLALPAAIISGCTKRNIADRKSGTYRYFFAVGVIAATEMLIGIAEFVAILIYA